MLLVDDSDEDVDSVNEDDLDDDNDDNHEVDDDDLEIDDDNHEVDDLEIDDDDDDDLEVDSVDLDDEDDLDENNVEEEDDNGKNAINYTAVVFIKCSPTGQESDEGKVISKNTKKDASSSAQLQKLLAEKRQHAAMISQTRVC